MANNLVIVESPAKAKTISKILGADYTVRASFGHIRDLPEKELGVDLEKHYAPHYIIPKDKQKVIKELSTLASKAKMIWVATDEDREGEAIGWHLLSALKIKDDRQYKRIVFHEITDEAIRDAIKHPRLIDTNLVDSQQARRVLDRLVGYKLSPLLWSKIRKGLSAGRVQSVAVRLVVEREREIQGFVPVEYWSLKAELTSPDGDSFIAEYEKYKGKTAPLHHQDEVERVLNAIGQIKEFAVADLITKDATQNPSAPFTTSTLQQEAARKLGYSVKQTMMIAQQLYEGIEGTPWGGLITYMRTDSTNLAASALKTAKDVITDLYGAEYALKTPRRYQTKIKGAQEAHEAIRPTNLHLTPETVKNALENAQYKLYKLIWERTIACQMAAAEILNTTVKLHPQGAPDYEFVAKGKSIKFPGFMKLYIEDSDDPAQALENKEVWLPPLTTADQCKCLKYDPAQHFTKPPARYTEASLVKKLESEGIGRPSTYAPTISTILTRGYIIKDQKYLLPTDVGFLVTDFLVEHFANIVDYQFTAQIEEKFDYVAQGKAVWYKMIDEFYTPFADQLQKKAKTIEKKVEYSDETCEKCGGRMVIRLSKYGKFLACSNFPKCRHSKPLDGPAPTPTNSQPTGEVCEKCGGALVTKKGPYGMFYACANYPECKFTKPASNPKTGVTCPQCNQGELVARKTKRGKNFYACNRYPECKYAIWNKPTNEKCECGGIMMEMSRNLKCAECGTTRDKPE